MLYMLDDIYILDVIYMCYVGAGCDICHIYVCMFVNVERKKINIKVTALPTARP
jgi:hypothetical protein